MFTCTQCGHQLSLQLGEANFCPQCGSRANQALGSPRTRGPDQRGVGDSRHGECGESLPAYAGIQQRLVEISRAMNSTLDLDTLLKKISVCACELTHAETGSTMLYDPERDELYFKVALGEKEDILRRLTVRDGIAWWVFANGLPAIVNDTASDSRFTGTVDKVTSFDTRNILCVPIILDTGSWMLDNPSRTRGPASGPRIRGDQHPIPAHAGTRIGVIEVINKLPAYAGTPQALTSPHTGGPDQRGVGDSPHQFTVEDQRMLSIFAYQAAIAVRNAKAVGDGRNFFINAIEVFVTAIESTEFVPPGHCMRVARSSMGMAHKLGIENGDLHDLYYASALHDIGVLDIRCRQSRGGRREEGRGKRDSFIPSPSSLLPPSLPPSHTIIGAEMVRPVNLLAGTESIIRHHHEAWDGSGYPDGIGGDDIPLGARIVAVAESYEERRAKSREQRARGKEEGSLNPAYAGIYALSPREFIAANAGRLFAPDVVDAFLEIVEQ